MTALRKFDYTPEQDSSLVQLGAEADHQLATMCPALVGNLRHVAERTSSALLFLSAQKSGALVSVLSPLADVFGGPEYLPEDAQRELVGASVFLKISGSTLAQRYLAGTLEPELHAGGQASVDYARAQVLTETEEPIASESDSDRVVANAASDGIA